MPTHIHSFLKMTPTIEECIRCNQRRKIMNTKCCGIVWGNEFVKHLKENIPHWREE